MVRNILLAASLFVALCVAPQAYALVEILPISPRIVDQADDDFFDVTSSGIPIVSLGSKAFLQVSADEALTGISWTFSSKPAGSNTSFLNGTSTLTALIPDVVGIYEVRVSATLASGEALNDAVSIVAGTFEGVGNLNGAAGFPHCAVCHPANADEWLDTTHATILSSHLNGMKSGQYDESCFECHSLGYRPGALPPNGGFDDAASAEGVEVGDLADQVNLAFEVNHDNDPDNDVAFWEELSPALRAESNVQCEMCHGPGSQHRGVKQGIFKPWNSNSCNQCHDSMGFDGHPYSHDSSGHSKVISTFASDPARLQTSCAKCHSSEGFVTLAVDGGTVDDLDAGIAPHGVTCVACHDPHDAALPSQLRLSGDVVLESGHTYSGGKGGLCASCHDSRISSDLLAYIETSTRGPHHGTQADVMLGVNAWDFGAPFVSTESVHNEVVEDTCVACHMATVPDNGWTQEQGTVLGGHSFAVVNAEMGIDNHGNACLSCHLTMTDVDRLLPESGQDYDGNGVKEGIQTEIKGLMAATAAKLQERYPDVTLNDDLSLNVPSAVFALLTFDEKAVIHNYRLMHNDGSYGVHNARFTVEVLQKSYSALVETGFASDFPTAFTVGSVNVIDWPSY
ncbi:MAG: cytochrome c3 family protein [Candidatus Hinthialibacter antarcticus]|nr:cytochrome c3 family protein [Candidatus Hinthialibacter antarcticus]